MNFFALQGIPYKKGTAKQFCDWLSSLNREKVTIIENSYPVEDKKEVYNLLAEALRINPHITSVWLQWMVDSHLVLQILDLHKIIKLKVSSIQQDSLLVIAEHPRCHIIRTNLYDSHREQRRSREMVQAFKEATFLYKPEDLPIIDAFRHYKLSHIWATEYCSFLPMMTNLRSLDLTGLSFDLKTDDLRDKFFQALRQSSIEKISTRILTEDLVDIFSTRPFSTIVLETHSITPRLIQVLGENRNLTNFTLIMNGDEVKMTKLLRSLSSCPLKKLVVSRYDPLESTNEALETLVLQGLKRVNIYSVTPTTIRGIISSRLLERLSTLNTLEFKLSDCAMGYISLLAKELFKTPIPRIKIIHNKSTINQKYICYLPFLQDNITLQYFSTGKSVDDVEQWDALINRNREGWTPTNHHLFPDRWRHMITILLKIQFLRKIYMPPEVLYQIFRFLQ